MFPKIIEFGGFFLPAYGFLVALGFLAGLWVVKRLAATIPLDEEKITNLVIYCALAGLAGAKLFMFLFDWSAFIAHPSDFLSFSTLQAAGVYQGGFLLALGVAIFYIRKHGLPLFTTLDIFAPGIAIGHAFGRIGCFAAGCCYGTECDRPWAVRFTNIEAYKMTGVPLEIPLHPTQLYEASFNLLLAGFLYWLFQKRPQPGLVFAAYLSLYSIFRFGVEFFRHHEQALTAGLSNTQWISLATLAAGLILGWRTSVALGRLPRAS
ncbi:MAG: prolipoprotein diacylglyceryl transferase [Bryobacteraceae bacterium]|nr:prolipoprotein diacylglyceryl transferase [Bryobacteraceae bacterium]